MRKPDCHVQLIESVNSDNLGYRIKTDIYFTISEDPDETDHAGFVSSGLSLTFSFFLFIDISRQ